jgi:hypothetical protein
LIAIQENIVSWLSPPKSRVSSPEWGVPCCARRSDDTEAIWAGALPAPVPDHHEPGTLSAGDGQEAVHSGAGS